MPSHPQFRSLADSINGVQGYPSSESSLLPLIQLIQQQLLPNVIIQSIDPHDPVSVDVIPHPWQLLGAGNYAAVFYHPSYPHQVVKLYAPGRPGFEQEVEVYRRIGSHSAFSTCFYAGEQFLVLQRLEGMTLYECLHRGLRIPKQVILDIDQALAYARSRGLYPHDVHGRNVMMKNGRGLVVDISDFLHRDPCWKWQHLKRAYYWLYRPLVSPLRWRVPYWLLEGIRKAYRTISKVYPSKGIARLLCSCKND